MVGPLRGFRCQIVRHSAIRLSNEMMTVAPITGPTAAPNMGDASDYSSTLHYLKAVEAAKIDDAKTVMAKMREMPVDDVFSRRTEKSG